MAVVGRVWSMEGGDRGPSWRYIRRVTWSSGCMPTPHSVAMHGAIMAGVPTSAYVDYMAAVLETWARTSPDERAHLAPLPVPGARADPDFNVWAVGGIPDLGGGVFHYP